MLSSKLGYIIWSRLMFHLMRLYLKAKEVLVRVKRPVIRSFDSRGLRDPSSHRWYVSIWLRRNGRFVAQSHEYRISVDECWTVTEEGLRTDNWKLWNPILRKHQTSTTDTWDLLDRVWRRSRVRRVSRAGQRRNERNGLLWWLQLVRAPGLLRHR